MQETQVKIKGIALDIDETLAATNHFWIKILAERFGNPDNFSPDEIVSRYRYTQHVPFWQTPEALAWMDEARNSNEVQEMLPLIENANHVVRELQKIVSISAYITARPEQVRKGTLKWLSHHGFPEAPLMMRPKDLGHSDSNKWKAELLVSLYPTVWGIIDDNIDLVRHLHGSYKGAVFLYDHDNVEETDIHVVAVKKWDNMLSAVSAFVHQEIRVSTSYRERPN